MKLFRNYNNKSDEELMVFLQKGDHNALSELYNRYSKKLLYYFYKMLWKDERLAQDNLHDLFEKIIDKSHLFDINKKFSTWIYSIANNMCKNQYRQRKNLVIHRLDHIDTHTLTVSSDNKLNEQEFTSALAKALATISSEHQSVFLLRYHEHMKIKEISEILKCSEGTVKSRLFHAKKNLAEQLIEFNKPNNDIV